MPPPVLIVVKGYWWVPDGAGVDRVVTAAPTVDHVTTVAGHGVVDLQAVTATPDPDGYWQMQVVASNDPAAVPVFAWTFTFAGYAGAWSVTVPHDAAGGETWLTQLDSLVTPPAPSAAFYTRAQTDALFTAVDGDVEALEARVAVLEGLEPQ